MSKYVILSNDHENILKIQAMAEDFQDLNFVAYEAVYEDSLNAILKYQPELVFLEIGADDLSGLSLSLINELHRYVKVIPKIVVTAKNTDFAYEAIKHEVFDYLVFPFDANEFRKTILKFRKFNEKNKELRKAEKQKIISLLPDDLTICIKSYGDYKYIYAHDILYLQADSNSTDIHLSNGEMITAFKTLKHFEKVLPVQFYRIHHSYIVNKSFISRIHTGSAVCFLKNTKAKIPFSKTYKSKIDQIIMSISGSDYLEI